MIVSTRPMYRSRNKRKGDAETQLTFRAVAAGLLVGSLLCCSNTYFGLQTGWVTMGSLQVRLAGASARRPIDVLHSTAVRLVEVCTGNLSVHLKLSSIVAYGQACLRVQSFFHRQRSLRLSFDRCHMCICSQLC